VLKTEQNAFGTASLNTKNIHINSIMSDRCEGEFKSGFRKSWRAVMSHVDWFVDLTSAALEVEATLPFQSLNEWMISRAHVDNPNREVYHVEATDIRHKRMTSSCTAGSRQGEVPRKLRASRKFRSVESNVRYEHFISAEFEQYGWRFQTCAVIVRATDGLLSSIFRAGAARLDSTEFKFKFDADTSDLEAWRTSDFGDSVCNIWRDYIYDQYRKFVVFCEVVSPLLKY
jgi:hypothetical protein